MTKLSEFTLGETYFAVYTPSGRCIFRTRSKSEAKRVVSVDPERRNYKAHKAGGATDKMKQTRDQEQCASRGHQPWVIATRTETMDAWGTQKRRVRYCTGCGMDHPSRRSSKA